MATTIAARRGIGETVRAYVALTKPRIIELLLVTAVPTMFLAAQGLPTVRATIAVLVGGAFAATGSFTVAFLTLAAGPALGALVMLAVREQRPDPAGVTTVARRERLN